MGLKNPAAVEGGKYDSQQIGPWTLWAHDLNADVMVVGQEPTQELPGRLHRLRPRRSGSPSRIEQASEAASELPAREGELPAREGEPPAREGELPARSSRFRFATTRSRHGEWSFRYANRSNQRAGWSFRRAQ